MENLKKVIKNLNTLREEMEGKFLNKKLKKDEVDYFKLKAEQYSEDLEIIKKSIALEKGVTEKDYWDIIININSFVKNGRSFLIAKPKQKTK